MIIFLIIGIVVGAITVIFALQNVIPVSVKFLAWQLDGSLALILILAVIAGLVISTLFALPGIFRNHLQLIALRKQVKKLESDLAAKANPGSSSSTIEGILS
jgi:lipopolysaccharide assembly protein A